MRESVLRVGSLLQLSLFELVFGLPLVAISPFLSPAKLLRGYPCFLSNSLSESTCVRPPTEGPVILSDKLPVSVCVNYSDTALRAVTLYTRLRL